MARATMVSKRDVPCKLVTLLGSTRFKKEFEQVNRIESAKGNLVFTVCWFTHTDGPCPPEEEEVFKQIHFHKILASDECVVVNPNDYIGEQTAKEIAFAKFHKIPVRYHFPHSDDDEIS